VPLNSNHRHRKRLVTDATGPQRNVCPGTLTAGCLKQLAEGRICRLEDRHVGIGGYGGHEPALMGVETGDDGAASRCAGAGCGVTVGEFYAALSDVSLEVGHEALEVSFGAMMPMGKTEGQRSSSTRMKRMLGCGADSVVSLAKPRRLILAFWSGPAVAVNFGPPGRVWLRFVDGATEA
jgi:hypothetical protein